MGRTTGYEHTSLGALSRVTDAAGRVTSYDYLPGGLLHRIVNPDGMSLAFGYDAALNVVTKTSQSGYELRYAYDSMGRVTDISNNQGQSKSYRYDAIGNRVSKTDGRGNVTSYAYTPGGELREVVEASGAVTRYDYDARGGLTRVCRLGVPSLDGDVSPRTTTYGRDALGRVTTVTDALGNRERMSYDAMGRLVSRTDADGYVTSFGFDAAGRANDVTFADGREVHMGYDRLSRLVELRDWLGTTTYEYDAAGNVTRTCDHAGREMRYGWGRADELRDITYPGGMRTSYDYDDALRLVGLHANGLDATYEYDESDNLSARGYSNGTGVRLGHDARGRLTHLASYDATGPLDELSYAYDLCDNKSVVRATRRGMPELSGEYAYGYDELNRLTCVTRNGQAVRSWSDEGERSYRYDERGNLVSEGIVGREAEATYEYDALGRLSCARMADGSVAKYTYDGMLHRRATQRQEADGATSMTEYVLDPTRPCNNLVQTVIDGRLGQSYLGCIILTEQE